MLQTFSRWLAICLLFSSLSSGAAEHPQLKAFPEAGPGMSRFVIELDHKERDEEQNFRVELIVGREMQTDGVNLLRLGSQIEALPLKGWGYTYYEVKAEETVLSTMMAAPEGAPKVNKFVTTAPMLIRYNSRLPVVIYVPEGHELRYRIWTAADLFQPAGQS